MSDHPLRVRLYRGREFHAVRALPAGDAEFTACGQIVSRKDEHLDASTPVTCRECSRQAKVTT